MASALAGSICVGAGQFCTSPGVVVVPTGAAGNAFMQSFASALKAFQPHAMLSAGIRSNFARGVARWRSSQVRKPLLDDYPVAVPLEPRPFLAEVGASEFIADHELHEEIFGSAALVVRTASTEDAVKVLQAVRCATCSWLLR